MDAIRNHLRGLIMVRSKRLALSLKPDIDLVVSDLALLTNQSKTTLINNLIKGMLPTLAMSVKTLKKLKNSTEDQHEKIVKSFAGELSEIMNDAQMELNGLDDERT